MGLYGTFVYLKIDINVVPNGGLSLPNGKDAKMNFTVAKHINIFHMNFNIFIENSVFVSRDKFIVRLGDGGIWTEEDIQDTCYMLINNLFSQSPLAAFSENSSWFL